MRKLIAILGLLVLMISTSQAQSVTNALKTINSDQVVNYVKQTDLNRNEYVVNTYYVPGFIKNARLTVQTDTVSAATDLPKVRAIVMRSPNNSDWYSVAGDTVTVTATTSLGHAVGRTALLSNVYENYLKVTVTAIDSVQNTKLRTYLLIDKNE